MHSADVWTICMTKISRILVTNLRSLRSSNITMLEDLRCPLYEATFTFQSSSPRHHPACLAMMTAVLWGLLWLLV